MTPRTASLHTTANLLQHTALRLVEPARVIAPLYELATYLPDIGLVTESRTDLETAQREFQAFKHAHAGERDAMVSIYDLRRFATVDSWRGAERIGPVDKMHPMARMLRRAVAAGQPVYVGSLRS